MRAAVSACGVCCIDVDEAAPVLGEFLVTDHAAESPDSGLVNGIHRGAGEPVVHWR